MVQTISQSHHLNLKKNPEPILNRELTWLAFNQRVLAEADRESNPLLERVKFLSIVNSNLDEFFMKRIGGLKQQIAAGVTPISADGRTPQQQIDECYEFVNKLEEKGVELWRKLQKELKTENIEIRQYQNLPSEQQLQMRQYFIDNIYPLVTPQAMDPAHPFPFISNLSLNMLITLSYEKKTSKNVMARIKVPTSKNCPRFIRLEMEGDHFITLEDLITNNLDVLFPEMKVKGVDIFRITRNAITEKDEEQAEDLLELIESELRERRIAPIVRMQVSKNMDSEQRVTIASKLQLRKHKDVFEIEDLMAMRDLMELMAIKRPDLKDQKHRPADNASLVGEGNIFHAIRDKGPFLIQLPYESFSTSVERFLKDASRDPKVIGIKMTIYRVAADAKIIEYLIDASRNGKQVTVVVEVKARFDESSNIHWANYLEEAGIHVTYGIVGLKTHAKLIYVLRQDHDGLRRYAHIGTGNYHSGTARLYSDLGILTADEKTGEDLTELFNYLTTGYAPKRKYNKLLPAPVHMKKGLLARIDREIENAKAGKKALIQLKTNALEDVDITKALYKASQAGVHVDLMIRDTCRLVPQIKGVSENVRVISIVGRFLEHTRIYYFYNEGNEEYYIGSADLMKRNLESRVEVITPIDSAEIREQLRHFIDTQLADTVNAWEMQSDGEYIKLKEDKKGIAAQSKFIDDANKRFKNANRLRLRKTR